jgi:hypothetical protein
MLDGAWSCGVDAWLAPFFVAAPIANAAANASMTATARAIINRPVSRRASIAPGE